MVDHFGNAITTIRASDIGDQAVRSVSWPGGSSAGMVATYAHIDGGPTALLGSAGHLEIAGIGVAAASIGGPRAGDFVDVELA